MAEPTLSPTLRAHLEVTYELLHPLGEGGMGVVWLARERLLEREVAIKVLRADAAEDPDTARRFLQEARVAAKLQHPGLVPLLTFGQVGGERFYVMPYVRGETLAERLRGGAMPPDEVARIVAEVADALAYVHARGIVHRDVKPANVLLDAETGRALLADFGIARAGGTSSTLTATGMVVGTPRYLAPEQASGGAEAVDGRADIYALGLVAWEALTGTTPFGAGSPHEVLARKLTGQLPSARSVRSSVPIELSEVVARATVATAADRWPDAAAFAGAVRSGAGGESNDATQSLQGMVGTWAAISVVAAAAGATLLPDFADNFGVITSVLTKAALSGGLAAMLGVGRFVGTREEAANALTIREALRAALRPPRWWPTWWPRRWVSFDLIDHLPAPAARAIRIARHGNLALWVGQGLLLGVLSLYANLSPEELAVALQRVGPLATGPTLLMVLVPMLVVGVITLVPLIGVTRRLADAGIPHRDLSKLLNLHYDDRVLRNPVLQQVRAFYGEASSSDGLPAFDEILRRLPSEVSALAAAGWAVADLPGIVSRLAEADVAWAAQERELEADADAAEAERLRERRDRLTVLEARSAAQDEMLQLLLGQLRLHEAAAQRLDDLRRRRARARDLTALLWRQLRALRAADVARAQDPDLTGTLRAVAADLSTLQAADRGTRGDRTPTPV